MVSHYQSFSISQLLQSGANDLGGTLMDENISRAAGADHGTEVTAEDFRRIVEPLGRTLVQRTTLYGRPDPSNLPLEPTRRSRISIPVAGA